MSASCATPTNEGSIHNQETAYIVSPDYEDLYNKLLEKHRSLTNENENNKKEISLLKEEVIKLKHFDDLYTKVNTALRTKAHILEQNLKTANLTLKTTQKKNFKQIKILTRNFSKNVEKTVKGYLSPIFTPNQMDLIIKKKKQVVWSKKEVLNATTLLNLSKHAYFFVKYDLHYPLPGKYMYVKMY